MQGVNLSIYNMRFARSDNSPQRFYSTSNQILTEGKKYYEILEKTQRSDSHITGWLEWFLTCLQRALENSEEILESVLTKSSFWEQHGPTSLNDRQQLMLNKLLGGFDGKLISSKWGNITKTSPDTASQDIQDLINKGMLRKETQSGRSTNYELNVD